MIVEKIPFQSIEYYQSLAIRDRVLRQPLGLTFDPQQLQQEFSDFHVIAKEGNRVVGTLILTPFNGTAKMRQVAVLPEFQSKGLGKLMVARFEKMAVEMELYNIVLHARKNAVPFYEKLGYTTVGDWFEEVGLPHLKMEKSVSIHL